MKLPGRFFLRPKADSENEHDWKCQVVVLDHLPMTRLEHFFRGDDGKMHHEWCPSHTQAGCPVCMKNEAPYHGMFLTVIELRPWEWTDSRGQERRSEYRRKLYVGKPGVHDFWIDLADRLDSLRGAIVTLERDGPMSPATGIPSFTGEVISEDELDRLFGNEEKVHPKYYKAMNEDISAVRWDGYEFPDVHDLIRKYGGSPVMGSKAYNEAAE